MKTKLLSLLMAIALLSLAGCVMSLEAKPETAQLAFDAPMNVNAHEQFHTSLAVRNVGTETFPGDKAFNGVMELRDEADVPRARVEVPTLGQMRPGESAWPAEWRGKLGPGAYQLTWGAPAYGSIVVDFTIVEHGGKLVIGEQYLVKP